MAISQSLKAVARAAWIACVVTAFCGLITSTGKAVAQPAGAGGTETPVAAPLEKVTVATKIAPPFAMQTDDGRWTGLAIDLLEILASDLKREIVWQKFESSNDIIDAVAKGEVNAGAAAISITREREKTVDFTHAYYDSGLAIAVSSRPGSGVWDIMRALTSPAFLTTVSMLTLLLFITGAIVWFVERKRNSDQFPKDPVSGIGNGFWWSAVTMTTVGYGDKAPITPLGRAIAVVWMFAALILTAVFTAQLTTALTLEGISGPVSGPKDLPRARVGILAKSATSDYFQQRFISTSTFETVEAGLKAVEDGEIDAFVHDEPILRYAVLRDFAGRIRLLEPVFEPQSYGIVLAEGSPLREPLNRALLGLEETNRWSSIRHKYLGESR